MGIREEPRFLQELHSQIWHDWRKGDYTKIRNIINYSSIDITKIPKKAGIYFFYCDEDLLYIGKSKNLQSRISTHISTNKHITNQYEPSLITQHFHHVNKVEYELYPEEDISWIEMFYICKLKPAFNS